MVFPDPKLKGPVGFYPLSNACGQGGGSYAKSLPNACPASDELYACDVDPAMKITSASKSTHERDTPPPLECRPRAADETVTGHYDPMLAWQDRDGRVVNEEGNVVPSEFGRADVEGCYWWGRGTLGTRGTCNLGKLDYYLEARAAREGRDARYPDADFCANPEAICANGTRTMTMGMRWDVALFEWAERVQSYSDDAGWNYVEELARFATGEGDLVGGIRFLLERGEPSHFVDQVGSVMGKRRKENFIAAVEGVGLPVRSGPFRAMEEHFSGDVS